MTVDGERRGRRQRAGHLGIFVACLASFGFALGGRVQPLSAQVISPGKLSAAHRALEGIRNCTKCHELGRRGIANAKCLECHTPLRGRIQRERGYHATVADQNCAECHKNHFGIDFREVRLDTAAFDHTKTNFALEESHRETACRDCHAPAYITASDVRAFKGKHGALTKTLLGVGTSCTTCHESDNVHGSQFPKRGCQQCHAATTWDEANRFDHGDSRYKLSGRHRKVRCTECHQTVRRPGNTYVMQFVNLSFAKCESCHEDVHEGVMAEACSSCHTTSEWRRINGKSFEGRFDHANTDFPLVGAHAEAECSSCHGKPSTRTDALYISHTAESKRITYPRPIAKDCLSCHRDYHETVFTETTGGSVCSSCHGEEAWLPASYDIERHNRESEYELTGAHLAVPCVTCHDRATGSNRKQQFRIDRQDCRSCHDPEDPHAEQFADVGCETCHDTDSFAVTTFDHDATRYPLDGAHRQVPCASCHREERGSEGSMVLRYKPLGTECTDCHGGQP